MNVRKGPTSPTPTSPLSPRREAPPPASSSSSSSSSGPARGDVELNVVKGNKLYTNYVYLNPADAQALTVPVSPGGLPHNTYLLVNLHVYLFKCVVSFFFFLILKNIHFNK